MRATEKLSKATQRLRISLETTRIQLPLAIGLRVQMPNNGILESNESASLLIENTDRLLSEEIGCDISDGAPASSGPFDGLDEAWLMLRLGQVRQDADNHFRALLDSRSALALRLALEKTIATYHETVGVLLRAYGNHFDDWMHALDADNPPFDENDPSPTPREIMQKTDLLLFGRAHGMSFILSEVLCGNAESITSAQPAIEQEVQNIRGLLHARTGSELQAMQYWVTILRPRIDWNAEAINLIPEFLELEAPVELVPETMGALSYQSIVDADDPLCWTPLPFYAQMKALLKSLFPLHRVHPVKTRYYKSPGGKAICFRSLQAQENREKPFGVRFKAQFTEAMPHVSSLIHAIWSRIFVTQSTAPPNPPAPSPAASPLNRLRQLELI